MPKSVDRYRTGRWSFSKKEAADIGWILVGYWLDFFSLLLEMRPLVCFPEINPTDVRSLRRKCPAAAGFLQEMRSLICFPEVNPTDIGHVVPPGGSSRCPAQKIREKSRKNQNSNSERRFFKNLEKSAFSTVILIFSLFFADFLG